jgi:ribosome-associated toxin RatA of RatAB toxin-antitoxin module
MRLIKFTESIEINCPRQRIFDYTQDYNQRLVWDTFLREAVLLDGAKEAVKGVKSWCVSKHGIGMETEYVSYNPPAVAAIKLTKPNKIFTAFAGSWRFEEINADTTKATFIYSFSLKSPFSLIPLLVKYILMINVKGRLRDLKYNLEMK